MNLVSTIVKGVIVATVVRELGKPENQRKLKSVIGKVAGASKR